MKPPAKPLCRVEMNAMTTHELRLMFTALQPITPRDLFAIRRGARQPPLCSSGTPSWRARSRRFLRLRWH